jgi:hypothetical protein
MNSRERCGAACDRNGGSRFLEDTTESRKRSAAVPFFPAARWKMSCTLSTARAASSRYLRFQRNIRNECADIVQTAGQPGNISLPAHVTADIGIREQGDVRSELPRKPAAPVTVPSCRSYRVSCVEIIHDPRDAQYLCIGNRKECRAGCSHK